MLYCDRHHRRGDVFRAETCVNRAISIDRSTKSEIEDATTTGLDCELPNRDRSDRIYVGRSPAQKLGHQRLLEVIAWCSINRTSRPWGSTVWTLLMTRARFGRSLLRRHKCHRCPLPDSVSDRVHREVTSTILWLKFLKFQWTVVLFLRLENLSGKRSGIQQVEDLFVKQIFSIPRA